MIPQEKEEHKPDHLSIGLATPPKEKRTAPPACPTGQPAGAERIALEGWNNNDMEVLEDGQVIHPVELPEAFLPPLPPYSNTGGTKCETTPPTTEKQVQKVGIDWLAFSAQEPVAYFMKFVNRFIPEASFFNERKGWQGYTSHYKINLHGQNIGILAYGGQQDKPYLSLTGKACLEIERGHNWETVARVIAIFFDYKLSRVDLKLDFFFNEVGHDYLKSAYQEGKFKLPKARSNPKIDPREPMNGNGQYEGRTLYIGSREGGKFFRGYEKGMEQFKKLPELAQIQFRKSFDDGNLFISSEYEAPEGATLRDWYRMEVEYKAVDRTLPIHMLSNRDDYFAGSYPICMEVLPMANPIRPKTLPNNLDIDEALMFKHMGDQYGDFLYSMLAKGTNPIEAINKILEGHWKHSQRYLKAGGLKDVSFLDPKTIDPKNWKYTPPED